MSLQEEDGDKIINSKLETWAGAAWGLRPSHATTPATTPHVLCYTTILASAQANLQRTYGGRPKNTVKNPKKEPSKNFKTTYGGQMERQWRP